MQCPVVALQHSRVYQRLGFSVSAALRRNVVFVNRALLTFVTAEKGMEKSEILRVQVGL